MLDTVSIVQPTQRWELELETNVREANAKIINEGGFKDLLPTLIIFTDKHPNFTCMYLPTSNFANLFIYLWLQFHSKNIPELGV